MDILGDALAAFGQELKSLAESAARSLEKGYLGITVCVKRQLFTSQAA